MSTTTTNTLRHLLPTEPLDLPCNLSLAPRLKLLLTFFRADLTVRPVDEWQLKVALLSFLRDPPLSLPVSDEDLATRRLPDLHKRRRGDPVASGTLHIRDLSFLKTRGSKYAVEVGQEEEEKRFLQWRNSFVEKLAGIELNLEGVKFKMSVKIPSSDDFEAMKNSWEDFYASRLINSRSSARGVARRPDTIIVRGIPSRWFAEPRVSSKASMLVTHTIFSALGKIRNLNIASDDELGRKEDETKAELVSGLNCKVWVQFESYDDFYNAMNVLCGRSLQKEGSRLKVDYEVTWDRDSFFHNVHYRLAGSNLEKRVGSVHGEKEHILHTSRIDSDRRKRFKVGIFPEHLQMEVLLDNVTTFTGDECAMLMQSFAVSAL